MKLRVIPLLLLAALLTVAASAAQTVNVVGSWKLVSVVSTTPDGKRDVLTIAIDTAGTEKAHRKSIETTTAAMAESKKKDRGGDVSL